MKPVQHQIVIIGGGTAGLSVASGLLKQRRDLDIAIIEPSRYNYYQPAWTLVGGNAYNIEATRRNEADYIPKGATWIQQHATGVAPDRNIVTLEDGTEIQYAFLVVAAGIQLDWDKIDGLQESLGKYGVTSNYSYTYAPYTNQCIQAFKGGRAIFTYPNTTVKCAGAPQKALYLAADHFGKRGIEAELHYTTAGNSIFGVPFYAEALDKVREYYGAHLDKAHNLIAIDGPQQKATFEVGPDKTRVVMDFDMIHVTPPQSAPDFLKHSPIANADGWVAVDKHTLQHEQFENIFSLGDCASTPNSKTAAAVRAQAGIVIPNLLNAIDGQPLSASYDGYAACPLTTSNGKMLLAEFTYGGKIVTSFPADPRVPRRSYWWLKKSILPRLYWRMLQGKLGASLHQVRTFANDLPHIVP